MIKNFSHNALVLAIPEERNFDDKPRQVGFEIEFSGIPLEKVAEKIAAIYKGKIKRITDAEYKVIGTVLGDFIIELDAVPVKEFAQDVENARADAGGEKVSLAATSKEQIYSAVQGAVGYAAERIVPCEIVCPPIKIADIPKLEALREALLSAGAQGTKVGLSNAFGVHINVEPRSLEIDTIKNQLVAFILLFDWLKVNLKTDFTRRLVTFIAPFPEEYVKHVTDPAYTPSQTQFIEDYLQYNPVRNRALDMLPLFRYIDKELVDSHVQDERINTRPTFHYRLPNCEIDNPDWSLTQEWNFWVEIENVANNPKKLKAMQVEYFDYIHTPLHSLKNDWVEEVDKWLTDQ